MAVGTFSNYRKKSQKKFFFLNDKPPPPLNGNSMKKTTFFVASLIDLLCFQLFLKDHVKYFFFHYV